ncbi:MAG: baseplate J/gp47 family protein [Paraclostridium sp.]
MNLDKNGYKVGTYEEILDEINSDIKSQIPNLSLDDSNPLIKLNKKMADMFHQMSLLGQQVYTSYSIDEAVGKALEDRVFWLGLTRLPSKKSSGMVEFTGVAGTFIPSNFRVGTQSGKIYYTLGNITLDSSGKGSVSIESLDGGFNTKAEVGTVTKIINPLNGINSVNNTSIISGGSDIETNSQLRARYYAELLGLGKSTIISIKNSILTNTTATKVSIVENDKDITDMNTNLPPHSFECFVLGGENNDILYEIYKSRPAGITSVGKITGTFDTYNVAFSRPANKSLSFSIKITLSPSSTISNVKDLISNDIISIIDGLDIGAKIDYTLFVSALYRSTGGSVISFTDLQFWIDQSDKKGIGDFIQLKPNELVDLLKNNINIEVL